LQSLQVLIFLAFNSSLTVEDESTLAVTATPPARQLAVMDPDTVENSASLLPNPIVSTVSEPGKELQ